MALATLLEIRAPSFPRASAAKPDASAPPAIDLNQIPAKVNFQNLAMFGTNLDVVLDALHNGGQLQRRGRLPTMEEDPRGVRRRITCNGITAGVDISNAFYYARSHALTATQRDPAANLKQPAEVPVIVIGDGMDTQKPEQTGNFFPSQGVLRRRNINGEVAFERLNIRTLLCQEADEEYVRQKSKDAGFEPRIITYEAFGKLLEKTRIGAVLSYDPGPEVRREIVETLTGAEYPDCPAWDKGMREVNPTWRLRPT